MSPTGLSLQRNTSNGGWRFYEKTDEKGAPIIGGELDLARGSCSSCGRRVWNPGWSGESAQVQHGHHTHRQQVIVLALPFATVQSKARPHLLPRLPSIRCPLSSV